MMRRLLVIVLNLLVATPLYAQGEETHPFSVHDMLAMDRISDPQVAPNGKHVVFVRRATDLEANKGVTDLQLIAMDGTGLRALTRDEYADAQPRWSSDGSAIYFLSARSGSMQVWRTDPLGLAFTQVTDEPLDVTSFALPRDMRNIAISMDVFPEATPEDTRDRVEAIAAGKATGRVYDRLFVRHWDSWKDGRRSHLFVRPLSIGEVEEPADQEDAGTDAASARIDLMQRMHADCPTKPFGGPEDYTFTPDGTAVVFTAKDVGSAEAWSTNFDLYLVPIDGSKPPENLTLDNPAWDSNPVFSPDGQLIAYLAMQRAGYEADKREVLVSPWPMGRATQVLTRNWFLSASSIEWAPDGNELYVTADHLGQHSLFGVSRRVSEPRVIVRDGSVGAARTAGERIVIALDHLQSPVEVYSVKRDGTDLKPITRINSTKIGAARMGDFEQFSFRGWNDEQVYAYVVKPVDFEESKKYPVAFLIHGGPQGSFGNHFHYRWNPQAYAGAGYAVVMVDFHGSTGYGQYFCDTIRGDWGGKPLEDLQKGLAAALEKYPWMDGERVAALGASFGGYMINWIAGQWPDRFRCLVSHDGNLDERAAYYMTEELWFPEWDHMGTPWENPEGYEKHNPIRFVNKWRTPILVVHGALDYRVVDTQGLSTFTAAQRLGVPSKLLYFPDENHWVLKPANSILWHETVIGWLDQWCKK